MIRGVVRFPIRYQPGDRLTSKQTRTLSTWYKTRVVEVGREIELTLPLEKVLVYSQFGPIELTHSFITIPDLDNQLYPVSTRIVDCAMTRESSAPVILHTQSIETLLNVLLEHKTTQPLVPVRDAILDSTIDNLRSTSGLEETGALLSEFKDEKYDTKLTNESAVLLPGNMGPWDNPNVQITISKGTLSGSPFTIGYQTPIVNSLTSYLADLTLQESYYDRVFYHYPIGEEFEELFNPYFGERYRKYDPIIAASLKHITLDPSILKKEPIGIKGRYVTTALEMAHKQNVIYPLVFSSNLLVWINFIHQLPVREIHFRYILPTRGTPYRLDILGGSTLGPTIQLRDKLMELVDLSWFWISSIKIIECILTSTHDLWMHITYDRYDEWVHIDLTVAALLSQAFIGASL